MNIYMCIHFGALQQENGIIANINKQNITVTMQCFLLKKNALKTSTMATWKYVVCEKQTIKIVISIKKKKKNVATFFK